MSTWWLDCQPPGSFQSYAAPWYPGAGAYMRMLIPYFISIAALPLGTAGRQFSHHTKVWVAMTYTSVVVRARTGNELWKGPHTWSLASRVDIKQWTERGIKAFQVLPSCWMFCCHSENAEQTSAVRNPCIMLLSSAQEFHVPGVSGPATAGHTLWWSKWATSFEVYLWTNSQFLNVYCSRSALQLTKARV